MRRPPLVLLCASLAVHTPSLAGQPPGGPPDVWIPIGPEGGTVEALAQDPTAPSGVWAATSAGGVFYSSDRGATWELRGFVTQDLFDLVPDSTDPDLLVGKSNGFWVSRDGGRAWEDLGPPRFLDLTVAVGSPPVLFRSRLTGPMQRSADLGVTWRPVTGLPADFRIDRLAQAAGAPERMWALMKTALGQDRRVFRSDDAGATWRSAEAGLPVGASPVDIAIGGAGDSTLGLLTGDGRLFVSQNGGDLWQLAGTAAEETGGVRAFLSLEIDRRDASLVYRVSRVANVGIRIAVSRDGGASFETVDRLTGVRTVLPLAGPGRQALFGLLHEGVRKGFDGATSVQPSSDGLTGSSVFSLGVLSDRVFAVGSVAAGSVEPRSATPLGPGNREALSRAFVLTLFERVGGEWRRSPLPASVPFVESVIEAPPDTLYAASFGSSILRSTDRGATWVVATETLDSCLLPFRLATTPAAPDRLLVTGLEPALECLELNRCKLFVSDDGGESFSCIRGEIGGAAEAGGPGLPNFVLDVAVDPADPRRIVAGSPVDGSRGLFRSLDGGASWEEVLPDVLVTRLLMLPATPRVVFAVGDDVWRSTDGGASWLPFEIVLPGGATVQRLFADARAPRTLLATGVGGGVFVSDDAGASWEALGTGLPARLPIDDLRFDADDPRTVYAATQSTGVFRLARLDTSPCVAGETTLCLNQGRFEVQVGWEDFEAGRGVGHARPQTADAGWFWFFDPSNVELLVKVIDGRVVNGDFWVFYGSLSNVELTITVRDTATGEIRIYPNPALRFASVGDTEAFPARDPLRPFPAPQPDPVVSIVDDSGFGICQPDATTLCLQDGRFWVRAEWRAFQGGQGAGQAAPLVGTRTDDAGLFWFFHPDNLELVVKVLDGRTVNGNFWFFYGALSNVEYEVEVTDLVSGRRAVYSNPSGRFASFGDTETFSTR